MVGHHRLLPWRSAVRLIVLALASVQCAGAQGRVLNGQVTGTTRVHHDVSAAGVPPRDVIVWLPPGYEAARGARYPVLYMLDGQNVIDPATSAFGTDWAADEAADSLIRAKAIAPLIIVGVYNSRERNAEYLPGASADRYNAFMVDVVKRMIDSTYRTQRDAAHTWVAGASAGATSAMMLVWQHPDAFSRAICMSPAFKAPDGSDMRFDFIATVRAATQLPRGLRVYADIGGVGLEERLRPGTEEMVAVLREKGMRDGRDVQYVRAPAAEHNELAWRARFPAALQWLAR